MKQPVQIQFLGVDPSPAIEEAIREKAAKLDQFCPNLMSCRVVVEQTDKHQNQGRHFAVRIDVTLPGHELAVNRVENEDAYIALRDAFDKMKRQVEETARRIRGD